MSYFNQIKKSDDEEKENKPKKRRSKTKQEELPLSSPLNFLSSIQIEKTSLILFDEVCFWFFK
jgi:hypothetical protein